MTTHCKWCSEAIHKTGEDSYADWRHKGTGSIFCVKVRGKVTMMAQPVGTTEGVNV